MATTTATSAVATATAASHDMSGMSMGGADAADCSVSMLWNWEVIDSCFLSSSWHVTTNGMFAVSCIGVALLGVSLEFLRRVSKDYEESIMRQFQRHAASQLDSGIAGYGAAPGFVTYRASPLQQIIRAVLHLAQFAVAYITMLIAMYYNGFIIISIFIGAFLGKLFFDWGQYRVVLSQGGGAKVVSTNTNIEDDATKCCG